MISAFDYAAPLTLEDLFNLYDKNSGAQFMSGGTDLLVEMREKDAPPLILDLKNIEELGGIEESIKEIRIGATTTVNELLKSPLIEKEYPALYQAAEKFGCYEIRNRATIGGSLGHASPGAEFGPVWAVLEARIVIASKDKKYELPCDQFTLGPGKTALKPGEIVHSVILPRYNPATSRMAYRRRARTRGMDLASMNCAVLILNADSSEERVIRVAYGALARTPDRPREIEDLLSGCPITPVLMDEAGQILFDKYSPRATSLRATPEYKKTMAGNLLRIILADLGLLEEK
ncbi:MAG: FAD binding domain-containing protein [Chloroflexi bacterium]|nr:FAD binding domain-containing protein [Chloroflexota bacterium]